MERKPYIGITGLELQAQSNYLLTEAAGMRSYYLMAGVLGSNKSFAGIKTRYPNRYPEVYRIGGIFCESPLLLNLVHYHTDDQENLLGQLLAAMGCGFPYCNGLQLNMAWPEYAVLAQYKEKYPDSMLVLQCGRYALNQIGLWGDEFPKHAALLTLVERVRAYGDAIDYVLLDMSSGEQRLLQPAFVQFCLRILYEKSVYPMLGIAGGLTADTLVKVSPLFKEFPRVSIDAEGGLRTSRDDSFSMRKALKYLKAARTYMCA